MKLSSLAASLFFAGFAFIAPASLMAHEGAHGAGDSGNPHGQQVEGSGSSVIEDPHGDQPGHAYGEGHEYGKDHEEEEGSMDEGSGSN